MDEFTIMLMTLGVFLVGFLIFREMVMWYWKINQAIDLLTQIEENTREYSVGNKVKKEGVKMENGFN